MRLVKDSIDYPVSTAVGVLLIALFGGISLYRIPVQLIPTVDKPEVRVQTTWPGALPAEVERQITQEQEEQLKGLEGLEEITSTSSSGRSQINLVFQIGVDINRALMDVSNRLQQVQRYPDEALKPQVRAASSDDQAIAFFGLAYEDDAHHDEELDAQRDLMDDVVAPALERVPGVSTTNIYGGTRHEMHFYADPLRLASRQLTIAQVANALAAENANVSGGDFDEGKANYTVRTAGEYTSPDDIENIVIAYRSGEPIFARDVGFSRLGFEKKRMQGVFMGREVIWISVAKTPGTNLLEVMAGVKAAAAELNELVLHPQGMTLIQASDSTEYIDSAIALLQDSVYVGAGLATVILLLFLRSVTSTLIIALTMPISVIGTFIVMDMAGRSFNVISLAGMAFAIGMVVDNSIVVLENIFRHCEMGKSAPRAAYDGAREVWGAVLASTLTTVAVFLPVIFIEEEAGQLFRDIAISISASVTLSMLVAITVIPALAANVLRWSKPSLNPESGLASRFGALVTDKVADLVFWICGGTLRRLAVVVLFMSSSFYGAKQLTPQLEYLPAGNSNQIRGNISLPSNYNRDAISSLSNVYEEEFAQYAHCTAEDLDCPGGGLQKHFFVGFGTGAFFGASANDPMRAQELIPVLRKATSRIPAVIGGFRQASLFQQGGPSGGAISLDIVGPDFDRLQELGSILLSRLQAELPEAQARPAGSIDRGKPEIRITPHRLRASQLGISARDLGVSVNALVDGAKVADYQWQGKRIDLKLMADEGWKHQTQDVGRLPIVARDGQLVTLDTVATVTLTSAPVSIQHRERQRASSILITPPPGVPLQRLMQDISEKVIQPMVREEELTGVYRIVPRGSADKLTQTWDALNRNLLFAVVITYLLMAALFQSFGYPFVILLAVPLAGFGGLLGLDMINAVAYQPLDVLTMLGFFILVGTVVNSAILIVHQALNHMREEGMGPRDAIRESTRTRIRPIFMSVLTSVGGMLPLVLYPGAGSELYRGIGSVVVGGLVVSTIFTLLLVPAMFSLFLSANVAISRRLGPMLGADDAVKDASGD